MNKIRIGIAGAGISGLISGRQLQRAGFEVFIFEARARTGGRIYSIPADGFVIEAGPEFIHGNGKETIALLKEYNISYIPIHGKIYYSADGEFSAGNEMAEGWGSLLEKMQSLEDDLPLDEFLNTHFPGNSFLALREAAIGFAEGFDLADPRTVSTQALIAEWKYEDSEQYRIPAGYGTVTRAIENEFKKLGGIIYLEQAINKVVWNSTQIKLTVQDGREFEVDKLIVSLPLSLLTSGTTFLESIEFIPVPVEQINANRKIGFGSVVKVILIWETSFWKTIVPDAQFIFSDCFIPTWWTQIPLDVPVLTGWLGGPQAEIYAPEPDAFFVGKALESLSSIFSIPVAELKKMLKDFRVFNWKNEPWSRGAYSYARAGYQKDKAQTSLDITRTFLHNRLYFTGEAYYEGPHPGTVEAAIVSGLFTARELEEEIIKK